MHIPISVIILGAIVWFTWRVYIPWREHRRYIRKMRRGFELVYPQIPKEQVHQYVNDVYGRR